MSDVRRWHRRLAAVAAVIVAVWVGSGLTHPLMSALGPRPLQFSPPPASTAALPVDLAARIAAVASGPLSGARTVEGPGGVWTQVWRPGRPPLYLSDQVPLPAQADLDYALSLARHYAGPAFIPVETEWIDRYSARYPAAQRLLPVWRLRDAQGREVLVDTAEDRLAAYTDPRRRLLSTVFQQLHRLAFLDGVPRLRGLLLGALMTLTLAMVGLGLAMVRRPGSRRGLPRLHRVGGAVLALPLLVWTGTGLFHLTRTVPTPRPLPPPAEAFAVGELPARLSATRLWQHEGVLWARLPEGQYQGNGERLEAEALARRLGRGGAATLLTRFDSEYGFVNRRLPVWRLEADGRVRYVDLARGQVVAELDRLDRAEAWSFSQLHKWGWADALGRPLRDAVMSLVALSILALAGLGLRLRRRAAKA